MYRVHFELIHNKFIFMFAKKPVFVCNDYKNTIRQCLRNLYSATVVQNITFMYRVDEQTKFFPEKMKQILFFCIFVISLVYVSINSTFEIVDLMEDSIQCKPSSNSP